MEQSLLTIGQAAKILGVSIDTLRRWDANGKLRPVRLDPSGHRYYRKEDIEILQKDLFASATKWAFSQYAFEPPEDFYCSNSAMFQIRLVKFQNRLAEIPALKGNFSLIVAVVGEIGNNSFDHNLGQWPDAPGIFFSYDLNKQYVVLADRGQGVLTTLKRVKPDLQNHRDALRVAFTEIISGRAPEERGNGLKFVRNIVMENPFKLHFQSGNAQVDLKQDDQDLHIQNTDSFLRGCLALLQF